MLQGKNLTALIFSHYYIGQTIIASSIGHNNCNSQNRSQVVQEFVFDLMLKEQKRGQGKLALVEEEGGANTREARLMDVAKRLKYNLKSFQNFYNFSKLKNSRKIVEEKGVANTRAAPTLKDVAKLWKFNLSPMLRSLRKDHGAKLSRSDFGGRNIFWLNITP